MNRISDDVQQVGRPLPLGKFERPPTARKRGKRTDETGMVRVTVTLFSPGTPGGAKGNMRATIEIANNKVSTVAQFIERALFGDGR